MASRFGNTGTFLGFGGSASGNWGFGQTGMDPRERARMAIAQIQRMRGVAQPRRAGANPPQNAVAPGLALAQDSLADQALAFAANAPTATQSSLDALQDRASQMSAQDYLFAISQGLVQPPNSPVYLPGFRAPRRRIFARRGFRGVLTPEDEIRVHDGETVTVDDPAVVNVTPKPRRAGAVRTERRFTDPSADPMQMPRSAGDQAVIERMSAPARMGVVGRQVEHRPAPFGPEFEDAAAQVAAQVGAVRESRRRAGILAQQAQARRQQQFEDEYLSGATIGAEGSAQFDQIAAGEIRPDQATSPAARRAGHALYATGARPIRDARRARFNAEAKSRLPAAQAALDAADRTPMTEEQKKQKQTMREKAAARRAERAARASGRRAAMGFADMDGDGMIDVNEVLTQRAQERRAAVQEFGTARPMAIGALRERQRMRQLEAQIVNTQQVTEMANLLKAQGGEKFDLAKVMASPDGMTNFALLIGMAKQDPSLLPLLDSISPELRAAVEAQMQAQEAEAAQTAANARPAGVRITEEERRKQRNNAPVIPFGSMK